MRARLALIASLAAAALVPAGAAAQRDTIRLGAPRDTVTLAAPDTGGPAAPVRDPRWSTPFAVESTGRAVPQRDAREVVWLDADSVRARRRAARLAAADSTPGDSVVADVPEDDSTVVVDSVPVEPARPRRRATADTASAPRRTTRTAARDTATTRPRRAAADTAAAPTRPRRATADTAAAPRRASTATRPRTHRVADGETLYGIARRYGVTTAQLRALNPDLVAGELGTGTVLRLPAAARAADAPRPSADDGERAASPPRRAASERAETPPARRPAAETRTPARGRRTHTVVARETLYGIARKYGVSVDAIKAANRLEGDTVRPGQTLTIPAATPR